MKNTILFIFLLTQFCLFGQSFEKNYNFCVKKDANNTILSYETTYLTVIFSGDNKGDIIFIGANLERFTKYSQIKNGKIEYNQIKSGISKDNQDFKFIETFNEKKERVIIQLFSSGVLRVFSKDIIYEYGQVEN